MALQILVVLAVILVGIDLWLRSMDYSLYRIVRYGFLLGIIRVLEFYDALFETQMLVEVIENNGNVALLRATDGSLMELLRKHQKLSIEEFLTKFATGKLFPAHFTIRQKGLAEIEGSNAFCKRIN